MPLKIFSLDVPRFGRVGNCPRCHRRAACARTVAGASGRLARKSVVSLTSRRQLRTLANTLVVVRVLCAEIASWLPDAAYFARGSTVAFKVYPVEGKGKTEGRRGSLRLACSSKGNIPRSDFYDPSFVLLLFFSFLLKCHFPVLAIVWILFECAFSSCKEN